MIKVYIKRKTAQRLSFVIRFMVQLYTFEYQRLQVFLKNPEVTYNFFIFSAIL